MQIFHKFSIHSGMFDLCGLFPTEGVVHCMVFQQQSFLNIL